MIALIRLVGVGFVVLTIIYVGLSVWSRRVRRRKLQERWDARRPTADREAFIRRGLERYDNSIRRKLILGVYVVPVLVVVTIIYLTNFY
ncbi:hypothetical protein SAMN04490248_11117 [Salinihabitans flavidus]|uniref:Cation/multidrug efflux pump n=1 Tax=Salinihabitans flavidus TaxID=569882 RepID=A0A1H8S6Q0_9RHOB|nr:hypothetical protein [Salinihabitans flavidus]SEO74361.1 hypothetical protein SAMN04490248_11117 [Salinihabitans flavidus]